MAGIYRILGARQASYGIDIGHEFAFLTIQDCGFDTYDLTVQSAQLGRAEQVGEIADAASKAEKFDALAPLENLPFTWAEYLAEQQRLNTEDEDDET